MTSITLGTWRPHPNQEDLAVIRLVEDAGVGNHNLDGHRAENLQQVGHVCGLHILMIFAIWDRPSAATCQCVVTKPHIDVKNKVIFSNRGFFRLNSRVRVRFRRHRLHAFFFITTSTQNHQKGVRCGTRWNICYEGKMLIMSPSQTPKEPSGPQRAWVTHLLVTIGCC
jgi:hypothetical protein